ncbi:type II toxin-antitoxin system VapC family toxin [Segetibacter aerophilus]|uniref:Twitching motility protein PilT n=1 Tax=Segetibacter aerophilus TaxID=670293 RepID=A0A512B9A0_9BACT|nr:PIN domain-containing protein [Segetibacter aerophilus]GEO08541.1 twitching motility protein PilT [Segetibacter aerophilus]
MRVFVDANILVSVLNKEYPLFTYTSRILSLADTSHYQIFTSPVCLAIAYYFAEKKYKAKVAKQKILVLSEHIQITTTDASSVKQTLQNASVKDFEDGLQYYSALNSKCVCIVTEDVHDFYFSDIEVLNSDGFFLKYMSRSK